jgi:putative two-component system response regulator
MAATIMLVDADAGNSSEWKAFLTNQGYRVVGVETGRTAIQTCPELKPDLVLLNSSLPDIPGFQVCKRLKADPLNRLMPVIMVVQESGPFEESRAFQSGADDFWSKPASRWEALNRVETILQLKTYIDQQAEEVLYALARSVEVKNPMTTGHSERLSEYTVQFGEYLGLTTDELAVLRAGSLLHDIGKVAVPDNILLKPGKLSPEELDVMRRHPVVGEEICAPLKSFRHLLPLIRHHHERPDGSGYPDGLTGDAIPLSAQILQMADIYDALTTDRPYRKEMTVEGALAVMQREADQGQLSQTLLREFSIFVWTTKPWQQGLTRGNLRAN